jgi:hypothetical protein
MKTILIIITSLFTCSCVSLSKTQEKPLITKSLGGSIDESLSPIVEKSIIGLLNKYQTNPEIITDKSVSLAYVNINYDAYQPAMLYAPKLICVKMNHKLSLTLKLPNAFASLSSTEQLSAFEEALLKCFNQDQADLENII